MISPTSAAKKKSRAGAPLTRKREQPFSLSDRSDTYVTWPVQILFLFSRRFLPHRRPIQFGPPTDCVSARNAKAARCLLHFLRADHNRYINRRGGGLFACAHTSIWAPDPINATTEVWSRCVEHEHRWEGADEWNGSFHFFFLSCFTVRQCGRKEICDRPRPTGRHKNRNKLETKKKCFQLTGIVFLAVGQPFSIYSRFESANVTVWSPVAARTTAWNDAFSNGRRTNPSGRLSTPKQPIIHRRQKLFWKKISKENSRVENRNASGTERTNANNFSLPSAG